MEQTSLLLPRAAILLLAPVPLGVVAWYLLYWDLFPRYSLRRLLSWFMLMLSVIGIPLLQMLIYRSVISVTNIGDGFVEITIFMQSALAVALAFYLLLRRRSRDN